MIVARPVSGVHHSIRPKANEAVIQRTVVCDSANVARCINDCSNMLVDDEHHQKELAETRV
jgi:hypothetical protein